MTDGELRQTINHVEAALASLRLAEHHAAGDGLVLLSVQARVADVQFLRDNLTELRRKRQAAVGLLPPGVAS